MTNKYEWAEKIAKEMDKQISDATGLVEWLHQGDTVGIPVQKLVKEWETQLVRIYLEKEVANMAMKIG